MRELYVIREEKKRRTKLLLKAEIFILKRINRRIKDNRIIKNTYSRCSITIYNYIRKERSEIVT